jgi:hypothetical protein
MLFSILYRYQYLHNFLSGKVFFTLSVANSLEDGARGRNRFPLTLLACIAICQFVVPLVVPARR